MPALIEDGYTSYKVFMTYDGIAINDGEILKVLESAKTHGAIVMVHAESDHCIPPPGRQARRCRRDLARELSAHGAPAGRARATHRAITLAEIVDVPILLVHVSAAEAMEQIRWARNRGLKVYGETCPQYLFLTNDHIAQPGWEGAKYLCAPPPRDVENQELLWRALARGVFQVLSSDHCSSLFEGPDGKTAHGPDPHFRHVPPGVPGIEAVCRCVLGRRRQEAYRPQHLRRGHGDQPGQDLRLYPRKGTMAVGADADLAIWDPEKDVTISVDMLHENLDFTPYEGFEVRGWPVAVISRGEVIVRDGEVLGEPGAVPSWPASAPTSRRGGNRRRFLTRILGVAAARTEFMACERSRCQPRIASGRAGQSTVPITSRAPSTCRS